MHVGVCNWRQEMVDSRAFVTFPSYAANITDTGEVVSHFTFNVSGDGAPFLIYDLIKLNQVLILMAELLDHFL